MPVDVPCEVCGRPVSRTPSKIRGRVFCGHGCRAIGQRKAATTTRRMRCDPSHPLAGRSGLVSEARAVLFERVGPGPHPCHWCGASVDWVVGVRGYSAGALVADHVDGNALNDAPENIVAACGRCNGTRHHAVGDDEVFINRPNGTRLRAVERPCEWCSEPFLAVPALVAVGKERFCSRSCARRHDAQVRSAR